MTVYEVFAVFSVRALSHVFDVALDSSGRWFDSRAVSKNCFVTTHGNSEDTKYPQTQHNEMRVNN